MIDLHQGFTGDEAKDVPASMGSVALAQLDVASALVQGKFRSAAKRQLGALKLLAEVARNAVKDRLAAKPR